MSETRLVSFAEAFKDKTGKNPKVPKGQYEKSGEIPVIDQGKNFIAGYTSLKNRVTSTNLPSIIFGDHTRVVKFIDFPFALGADGVKVLEPQEGFVPKYLYWKLKETHIPDAGYSRHFKFLKEANFPQPSIEEQEKYVLQRDLQEIIEQKRARQRELFEELSVSRYEKVISEENLEWVSLGEITDKIGSGSTPRGGSSSYKTEGIALIRSMNVHDREFRTEGLVYLDDEQAAKLSNVEVQENDVLLNITGASVARCCVVPKDVIPARVNQHVCIIRLKTDTIDAKSLERYLTLPSVKRQLLKIATAGGATREAITKAEVQAVKVPFLKV